jgi:hypothetical protein
MTRPIYAYFSERLRPRATRIAWATLFVFMGLGTMDRVVAQGTTAVVAPVPKLEMDVVDKPQHFKLTRTEASTPCFLVRNISGGDLTVTDMVLEYVQDPLGKTTLPDPTTVPVSGWSNTLLKDKAQTRLCVMFPAPQKLGEYDARFLMQTGAGPDSREKFADAKVTVGELSPPPLSSFSSTVCSLAVGLGVLILALFVRRKQKRSFLQSPDGDYSVSRFQVMAWTIVVVSSFTYLYFSTGKQVAFPDSVMYLMGISIGSLTGAKILATTKSQTMGGGVAAGVSGGSAGVAAAGGAGGTALKPLGAALASMLSDNGQPSTMRYQMFVWTIVAAIFFLRQVWAKSAMWDVPNGLLVLMGISHGGYLLDKGVSPDTSMKVQSVQPSKVPHDTTTNLNPATPLVIVGLNFNPVTAQIKVTLGGKDLPVTAATASQLNVTLPAGTFAAGHYDLVVQQPGEDAEVLKSAFEVQ